MALDITATITCDMCGRSDTRPLRESMRHGKLATVERGRKPVRRSTESHCTPFHLDYFRKNNLYTQSANCPLTMSQKLGFPLPSS